LKRTSGKKKKKGNPKVRFKEVLRKRSGSCENEGESSKKKTIEGNGLSEQKGGLTSRFKDGRRRRGILEVGEERTQLNGPGADLDANPLKEGEAKEKHGS